MNQIVYCAIHLDEIEKSIKEKDYPKISILSIHFDNMIRAIRKRVPEGPIQVRKDGPILIFYTKTEEETIDQIIEELRNTDIELWNKIISKWGVHKV